MFSKYLKILALTISIFLTLTIYLCFILLNDLDIFNFSIYLFDFQGASIPQGGRGLQIEGSLVLQGVDRGDTGRYACQGRNSRGRGRSQGVALSVLCQYCFIFSFLIIFFLNTQADFLFS